MKNLLIVGAGIAGSMVSNDILNNSKISLKYNIVGFLDDDESKKTMDKIPVLGRISDAEKIITENTIDEVIIAIPSADKETVNRIINSIYSTNVAIKIVPGLYEIIEGKVKYSQIRKIEPSDLLGREEVGFDLYKISEFYKDKTVFVTGAGGSIGSEIFLQLFDLPVKKVIAFGHGENSIHSLITKLGNDRRFGYVIGDVKDVRKINHEIALYSPDIVIHAAAHKHVPLMEEYPDESVKNNIFGTYNTAVASINAGVKNFLFVSTDKAVNPTSVMGVTKRLAEKIILSLNNAQQGTKFHLTRFGNVLGSRGSVIPIFIEQIESGRPITITHKDIERYFMSIREAARLVIKSLTVDGNIFVLDMGQPVKILTLARNLIKMYGYEENEIPIVFTGLRPGEKMYEEILTGCENLKKTEFNKLFVSHENGGVYGKDEMEKILLELETVAGGFDSEKIKDTLRKYVPEFQGGKMNRIISFSPPDITQQEIDEVADTLRSGWITTGPKTKKFETEIASYCKAEKCACVNSATAALELVLRIFGIKEGDEVITTPYTYAATANIILHVGAKPVFVDVAKDGFNIDPDKIFKAITKRTKAVIPVDFGGEPCDYDEIKNACELKKKLYRPSINSYQRSLDRIMILSDSAHSFGASYNGRKIGVDADFNVFSFHAVKNITTAEGGAVTFGALKNRTSQEIYNLLMLYSLHGQDKDALAKTRSGGWKYSIMLPGYKCNMTDIFASLGLVQLSRYDAEILPARKIIYDAYESEFARDEHFITPPFNGKGKTGSYHLYPLRIKNCGDEKRSAIISLMADRGISCNVHFIPLPLHPVYEKMGYKMKDYPIAYSMYENEISLPVHSKMNSDDAKYVADTLKEILTIG